MCFTYYVKEDIVIIVVLIHTVLCNCNLGKQNFLSFPFPHLFHTVSPKEKSVSLVFSHFFPVACETGFFNQCVNREISFTTGETQFIDGQ